MRLIPCIVFVSLLQAVAWSAVPIQGELKQWHRVTLGFEGPSTSETATPNPFRDYRLDATFTGPSGQSYTVPGFYAADGDAAETSAGSGNIWRVNFAFDEPGEWDYTVSFVTGADVAADLSGGTSAGFFDGQTGNLTIFPSDKSGSDLRARGKLEYVGEHFLRFRNGEHFLKFGPNSPEVFMEFKDFDNTPSSRTYSQHVGDWNSGDPTWQGGKGKGIIGVVNYLAEIGVNVHYFLTMNSFGDGKRAYPWIDDDSIWRYDCSKLDQWEIVFEHFDRKGMMMHFVLTEVENQSIFEHLDPSAPLGGFADSRKIYYREMVARFGHHMAITWNVGEENGWDKNNSGVGTANSTQQRKDFADRIRALTYYDDPITIHNGPSNDDSIFNGLTGHPSYSGAALQWGLNRNIAAKVKQWRDASIASGHLWVVSMDEPYSGGVPSRDISRQQTLWPTFMAGGAGVEWFFGGGRDLSIQDYRTYENLWMDGAAAIAFFQENVPFWEMEPADGLLSGDAGGDGQALSKANEVYVVYLPDANPSGSINLSGASGDFTRRWFNPREGVFEGSSTTVAAGSSVALGPPPNSADKDWVILLEAEGGTNRAPVVNAGPDVSATLSGASVSVVLNGNVSDDGLPEGSTLETSWIATGGPAAVIFSDVAAPATTATFTAAGVYTLVLTGSDGELAASDVVVITIRDPASNVAPVVDAGPDKTVALNAGSATVALAGSTSDDGLPAGSTLATTWTRTSGPGSVVFSSPASPTTNASFTVAGSYVLRLSASDSLLTSSDEVTVTVASTPPPTVPTTFGASHDAYLQNGTNYNNADLRIESTSRSRISYLQFDLSELAATPTTARLRLTEGSDTSGGTMTLRLFAASSNEWTESGLTGSNAPLKGIELDSYTGDIPNGKVVEFDVSALVSGPGIYSFILQADASPRDVAFASSENSSVAGRPQLVVTLPQDAPDDDGFVDGELVITGLSFEPLAGGSGGELRFDGLAGIRYTVERSTDLIGWEAIHSIAPEAAGVIGFVDPDPPLGSGFYRVVSEP